MAVRRGGQVFEPSGWRHAVGACQPDMIAGFFTFVSISMFSMEEVQVLAEQTETARCMLGVV